MNFYSLIEDTVREYPKNVAVKLPDNTRITYEELSRQVSRYVNALTELEVPRGAKIIAQVEKSLPSLYLYLACLKAGFVFVPLNTAYRSEELKYFIEDAKPALVVVDSANVLMVSELVDASGNAHTRAISGSQPGALDTVAQTMADTSPLASVNEDDVATIIYTSGTTGRSKGAMVSHRNLISNVRSLTKLWVFTDTDTLIHALPIFHVHGLFVANHCALTTGATMIWLSKFEEAKVIDALGSGTVMMGVPTFYTRLLAAREFTAEVCRSMRLFISGSAPLLAETHESFEARVGHRILERYGMSEAGMITSNPYEGIRKPGTVGKPLPDVELRLVGDDGEACRPGEKGHIQIKGPNVFLGYLNLPDKTRQEFTEDGWFKTGDIGELDDDQYVSIVGRSKDLIITGGYNVYPKEIEAVIDEDERVVESAVFGIADPDFGEAVTAAVVLVDGAVFDQGAFIVGLKERLASYKVPKEIHVVPALPRNAMGKVQKSLLRDTFQSSEQVNKL